MIESPLLRNLDGYISGVWVSADSGSTFDVHNPANGEKLAEVAAMGREETLRAIEAARTALKQPVSLDQRREWLFAIAQALKDNREEIGRILCSEHGKPWKEGQGEADYAAGFFEFAARNLDALKPHPLDDKPRGCTWTVHYRPAGVVGLITPWNFPIGMIAKKLSSAIAADCPSVIKPSSKTPLTMIALFSLLDDIGLPPGKVNLVMGSSGPIGDTLMEHADVAVVSFTGSTSVGQRLIEQSAAQVKKLCLELGGNAPFIVFEDADLDAAVEQLIGNKFRGGGQTCVCANRVFVHEQVSEAFAARLGERVASLKVGDGMLDDTDLGPLIDRNGFEKVRRHAADAEDALAHKVRRHEAVAPLVRRQCPALRLHLG